MITITTKSPDLAIPFADVLNVDTIQDLKDGLGMMGMRFTGKPTKAHIVKTFDEYIKENPADVLRCQITAPKSQWRHLWIPSSLRSRPNAVKSLHT